MVTSITKANELIEQQQQQIQELLKQLQSANRNKKMLQHQLDQLLRRVYGRRSEKLDPNQLMFDNLILEAIDQPLPQPPPELPVKEKVEKKRSRTLKRRHPGRIPIPEHLERVEIVLVWEYGRGGAAWQREAFSFQLFAPIWVQEVVGVRADQGIPESSRQTSAGWDQVSLSVGHRPA